MLLGHPPNLHLVNGIRGSSDFSHDIEDVVGGEEGIGGGFERMGGLGAVGVRVEGGDDVGRVEEEWLDWRSEGWDVSKGFGRRGEIGDRD